MDKFLTEDQWEDIYQPGEILEEFPEGVDPTRIWTEIESDGYWSIAAGNHLVNRTGRYYVSAVPHDYDVFVEDELPELDEEE